MTVREATRRVDGRARGLGGAGKRNGRHTVSGGGDSRLVLKCVVKAFDVRIESFRTSRAFTSPDPAQL